MNPIVFALRNPVTVMVGVATLLVGSSLAMSRMRIDVFPSLNQPVIYICQPYGGMTPQQMEGLLTSYYEFHFLYVNGVHHIESKNIQSMSLLKVSFHPGTEMGQAMGEVVAAVNRARFMMPPNTVPPFITRLDTGSAAVGYLVLSSETKSIKEIQDMATVKVRPMFANVQGMSSPPAFGGNQRAIVVSVDVEKLRGQGISLDHVTEAVASGNSVMPSGNLRINDRLFLVSSNVMVGSDPIRELEQIPVKMGDHPVLLGDVAKIEDGADITAGYALVNGKRSVYMLVTKRADASTISVVNGLREALPRMRESVPEDVRIEFAFDQSEIVTEAMWGVASEGFLGALLTGVMVLLFLRDWRSVIVVVLNIPLALCASVFALWVSGQTINLMTLGGLALAVGILVDEATVEVENIHTQMLYTPVVARAVRRGNSETAVPRLLAMLCILAVFVPSFFMEGAARELFVPLSLAVGFSMIASYILSSTFVPVLSVWLLKPLPKHEVHQSGLMNRLLCLYETLVAMLVHHRRIVLLTYLVATPVLGGLLLTSIGNAIFPPSDKGQFLVRIKGPTGTRIERTEELTQEATRLIKDELGAANVETTIGYVGMFPTNYPIQAVHQWTSGPEEVLLRVSLKGGSSLRINELKDHLRDRLNSGLRAWLTQRWQLEGVTEDEITARLPGLRLAFEPGDLVSEVMSFGAPTPVEVQINGPNMTANLDFARTIRDKMAKIPELRDIQLNPAQDYPTIDISIDRARAATMGASARTIGLAIVPATASSRYMNPIYWRDPLNGQAYIVQVQIPHPAMNSSSELGVIPVRGASRSHAQMMQTDQSMAYMMGSSVTQGGTAPGTVYLRDVATIRETTVPSEIDRYNMRRVASITATISGEDLGKVRRAVLGAIAEAGTPPRGVLVDVRGQLETLHIVQTSLGRGLGAAVLAIFLLLVAYYQSPRLAIISISAIPATLTGVGVALLVTGSTLNLQSFMGAIMALGVSVANAILLVTFAERARLTHGDSVRASIEGGRSRLRPILMTSSAMLAGMMPMAIGMSSGGEQSAPLGRAVVGGLFASTLATLLIVPSIFSLAQRAARTSNASLDPDDPNSKMFDNDQSTEHDRDGIA